MKLLKRKNPLLAPIVPWHYRDSVTGFEFNEKYHSKDHLISHIRAYREMNGMEPLEHLDEIVEDFICRQPGMDPYIQEYEIPDTSNRTFEQYLAGAQAFIKTARRRFSKEETLTPDEVANKRALTCLNCPHNAESPNKTGLEQLTDNWMMRLTKDKSTKYDAGLKECQKCGGCPLKAKIWIAQEVLDATTPGSTNEKLKEPIRGINGDVFLCWARRAS